MVFSPISPQKSPLVVINSPRNTILKGGYTGICVSNLGWLFSPELMVESHMPNLKSREVLSPLIGPDQTLSPLSKIPITSLVWTEVISP